MARKKTGQWMVVNVVINGINLGKTFRNQFVRSAQRAGGDIEQVINGWSSELVISVIKPVDKSLNKSL